MQLTEYVNLQIPKYNSAARVLLELSELYFLTSFVLGRIAYALFVWQNMLHPLWHVAKMENWGGKIFPGGQGGDGM